MSRGLCRVDLTLAAIALDIGIARIAIRHLQFLGMLRASRQGGGFRVRPPNDSGAKSCRCPPPPPADPAGFASDLTRGDAQLAEVQAKLTAILTDQRSPARRSWWRGR